MNLLIILFSLVLIAFSIGFYAGYLYKKHIFSTKVKKLNKKLWDERNENFRLETQKRWISEELANFPGVVK